MLLWVIRAFFVVIIVAVLLVNLTVPEISGGAGRTDFYAILWCGLALVCATFFAVSYTHLTLPTILLV